ncbi:NUDIX hydrolase [Patescibacteria group bacterium]|nr:NUDIX hydrolase [Patescibacteria group bacterium]
MDTQPGGSFALMVAIYSRDPNKFLLIKNHRERRNWWKLIGEQSLPGESWRHTLVRALWEEAGFKIHVTYDELGNILELGDPEISIAEVRPPMVVQGRNLHQQYFCKVRLPYARLRDLSGKRFNGADADEDFETKVVSFDDVFSMPDFFPKHLTLFREFLGYAT